MRQTGSAAAMDALWRRAVAERQTASPPPGVQALSQALGERAMECVSASVRGRREELVAGSVTVLETLLSIWAACGLSPDEIWVELHKREQLGSLLMLLNQAQGRLPRRLLRPWRVDSTKLP